VFRIVMANMIWVLTLTGCAAATTPTRASLNGFSAVPSVPPVALEDVRATATDPSLHQDRDTVPPPLPLNRPVESPSPEPTLMSHLNWQQLTSGGCCVEPFWSADSHYVEFIDNPPGESLGIYAVAVDDPGQPELVSERVARVSANDEFYVYPEGNVTVVERRGTGETYRVANGGREVKISPDGTRLLWQVFERRGDFDKRLAQTYVSDLDGSNARLVGETLGIVESEWIDAQHILLAGVPLGDSSSVGVAAVTLGTDANNDTLVELAHVARPQKLLLSPQGTFLVFLLSFQADPERDGLWIVRTDGSEAPKKLGFFGSYRWRDDSHLLYVPFALGAESHAFWEYGVLTARTRRLTDPSYAAFRIANSDWNISPNGQYIVFVNAIDRNLWLIDLGDTF
jgi:hypothetical protein